MMVIFVLEVDILQLQTFSVTLLKIYLFHSLTLNHKSNQRKSLEIFENFQ